MPPPHKIPRELADLMHAHGYQWVRRRRHDIWRHAETGRIIVTSTSASDHRTHRNLLALLRRQQVSPTSPAPTRDGVAR